MKDKSPIPDELIKLLQKGVEKKRNDEKIKRQVELKAAEEVKKKEREYKDWLESKRPQALEQSREIFSWLNDLIKNREFTRLMKQASGCLYIFSGGDFAETVETKREWIMYVGIDLEKRCLYWYHFSCGAPTYWMKSPEDMVNQLDPRLIQLLLDNILSGKVWDDMKEKFNK